MNNIQNNILEHHIYCEEKTCVHWVCFKCFCPNDVKISVQGECKSYINYGDILGKESE